MISPPLMYNSNPWAKWPDFSVLANKSPPLQKPNTGQLVRKGDKKNVHLMWSDEKKNID